jgi:hypothetical protein
VFFLFKKFFCYICEVRYWVPYFDRSRCALSFDMRRGGLFVRFLKIWWIESTCFWYLAEVLSQERRRGGWWFLVGILIYHSSLRIWGLLFHTSPRKDFFFFFVKGFPQNFGKLSSSRLVVGVEWGHHLDRFEAGDYECDVFTVNLIIIFHDK